MVLIVATSLVVFNRSATSNPTFADNVSSLFAGMPQISQSISSNAALPKIKIPFAWLILVLLPHLMCFLAVSRSLRKDMYLVMSSSKSFYPILLTVSCVTATGLYWIMAGVVILLFTLLHGGEEGSEEGSEPLKGGAIYFLREVRELITIDIQDAHDLSCGISQRYDDLGA